MKYPLLLIAVLLVSACTPYEQETITIGQLASLTSFGATFGTDEQRGAALAVEELNAAGGINGKQIRLVVEDIQTDQRATVNAYTKLVSVDHVHYIIGPTWGTFVPGIIDKLQDDNVLLLSPSTGEELAIYRNPNFFKTWPADKLETRVLIKRMEREGTLRIATVNSNGQFSQSMKEGFLSLANGSQLTVVNAYTTQVDESDFRTIIEKLKQERVQAIYLVMESYTDAGEFLKQSEQLGLLIPVYGWTGMDNNPQLKTGYTTVMERVIYPHPKKTARDEAFAAKFTARYGEPPNTPVAATAYDAIMVLAQALKQSDDVQTVRELLHATHEYEGASSFRGFQETVGWPKSDLVYFTKTMRDGEYVEIP